MIAARWMGFALLLIVSSAVKAGAAPPPCVNASLSQSATELLEAAQQLADDGKVSQAVAFLTTQAEQPSYSDDRSALLLGAGVLAREDQQSVLAERYLHNALAATADNDVRRHTILKQLSSLLLTQQRYREVVDLYDGVERCKSWVLEPPYNLAEAKLRLEDFQGVVALTQQAFDYLDSMPPDIFVDFETTRIRDIRWQILDLHAHCFLGHQQLCSARWQRLFQLRKGKDPVLSAALQAHVRRLQGWPAAKKVLDEARESGCLSDGGKLQFAAGRPRFDISAADGASQNRSPAYPVLANKAGRESLVVLEVWVGGDGDVKSARVVHTRPDLNDSIQRQMNSASVEAILSFRYSVPDEMPRDARQRMLTYTAFYLTSQYRLMPEGRMGPSEEMEGATP